MTVDHWPANQPFSTSLLHQPLPKPQSCSFHNYFLTGSLLPLLLRRFRSVDLSTSPPCKSTSPGLRLMDRAPLATKAVRTLVHLSAPLSQKPATTAPPQVGDAQLLQREHQRGEQAEGIKEGQTKKGKGIPNPAPNGVPPGWYISAVHTPPPPGLS